MASRPGCTMVGICWAPVGVVVGKQAPRPCPPAFAFAPGPPSQPDHLRSRQIPFCQHCQHCHHIMEVRSSHSSPPPTHPVVDLLPTHVSLRILWELPRGLQARVLWAAARRQHPEPIVAGAVADPEVMGYLKLYVLLLDRAKPRLATALRLCADPGNLPLLVHCIHGKDRTGLVAMLLLLLCGAEREAVVRDYALSEVLLRESREKRQLLGLAEHLTTDQIIAAAAHVMEQTIGHLEGRYGSARNYMKALGLTDKELEAIVRNLTQPGLALPATAAEPAPACANDSDTSRG
ncbi:hypothetical protein ABPG75_000520 [Micractinium tetrahymenae]